MWMACSTQGEIAERETDQSNPIGIGCARMALSDLDWLLSLIRTSADLAERADVDEADLMSQIFGCGHGK
jgi:hypothetical protein